MRHPIAAFALLAVSFAALAQQSATVDFAPPDVCVVAGTHAPSADAPSTCVPAGYRLYRDGALVGSIAPGGSMTFAGNGTFLVGVEAFDADGSGPLVTRQVVLGPPPTVPGPVRNFTITASCATSTPVQCTFTVTDPAP